MSNPGRRAPEHPALEHTRGLVDLRTELERWEATAHGDPLGAHRGGVLGHYLVELRALAGGHDDRSRAVLLAALALGPRIGGLPGTGDLGPLLEAAVQSDADAVELAIAWGCGWRRSVTSDHEWHGRWVAALLSLSSLVGGSINRTVRWLGDQVSGVREALGGLSARDRAERFDSHAQQIALELSLGACRCGHGGGSRGPCGRPGHRLASWRPDVCDLRAFVATAVRGSAGRPRAGAFAGSMLAELLCEDHVVRLDVAEFNVCHACNPDVVRRAAQTGFLDLGGVTRGLHDLGRCPACGAQAHPGRTYRVARRNWLVVPADWGGWYDAVQRHRCACCGNLFVAGRDRCPLCRHPVPSRRRLRTVWTRRIGREARASGAGGEARGS